MPPEQPLGREAELAAPGGLFGSSIFRGLDDLGYPRPGKGFRATGSTLHLGIVSEGGYLWRGALEGPRASDHGLGYGRLLPRFSLDNLRGGSATVRYWLRVLADYAFFPNLDRKEVEHRVGLRADVGLRARTGAVRFHLWERFARRNDTIEGLEPWFAGSPERLHSVSEVGLEGLPGRAPVYFKAAYRFTASIFEPGQVEYGNQLQHALRLSLQRAWFRWLVLGLAVEAGYVDHMEEPDIGFVLLGPVTWNRWTLRARLTVESQLGPAVRLRGAVGYGGSYLREWVGHDKLADHDVVGELGGRFEVGHHTWLWVGYWHDFRSPPVGRRQRVDQALVRIHSALTRGLTLDATAAWVLSRFTAYYAATVSGLRCSPSRIYSSVRCESASHYVQLSAQLTGYFLPWLSGSIGYLLRLDVSERPPASVSPPATIRLVGGDQMHRVYGRLSVHY